MILCDFHYESNENHGKLPSEKWSLYLCFFLYRPLGLAKNPSPFFPWFFKNIYHQTTFMRVLKSKENLGKNQQVSAGEDIQNPTPLFSSPSAVGTWKIMKYVRKLLETCEKRQTQHSLFSIFLLWFWIFFMFSMFIWTMCFYCFLYVYFLF